VETDLSAAAGPVELGRAGDHGSAQLQVQQLHWLESAKLKRSAPASLGPECGGHGLLFGAKAQGLPVAGPVAGAGDDHDMRPVSQAIQGR